MKDFDYGFGQKPKDIRRTARNYLPFYIQSVLADASGNTLAHDIFDYAKSKDLFEVKGIDFRPADTQYMLQGINECLAWVAFQYREVHLRLDFSANSSIWIGDKYWICIDDRWIFERFERDSAHFVYFILRKIVKALEDKEQKGEISGFTIQKRLLNECIHILRKQLKYETMSWYGIED